MNKEEKIEKEEKDTKQESGNEFLTFVAILSFLCTCVLFAIAFLTNCNGFLCNLEYIVFGVMSLPMTLFSLLGAINKEGTFTIIGVILSILFFIFMF